VLGASSLWKDDVQYRASKLPWRTEILMDVPDMAALMAEADLAIGAVGVTALERCSLGLPALAVSLAQNQVGPLEHFVKSGALLSLGNVDTCQGNLEKELANLIAKPSTLYKMMNAAKDITDGLGCERIVENIVRDG
jgi:spore coat polysaccharide biosynthesis predicted glycosyltransferase SpsG